MENTTCPHCQEATIEPVQKFKAVHWKDVYCNKCGGRSAMFPIGLALLWFGFCWDLFFFGFMAVFEKSWVYAVLTVVGWALLEFFGYYIPLVKLRTMSPRLENK